MKNRNLLKLLASVALVFSLAACNGPKKTSESSEQGTSEEEVAKVITIAQAIGVSFDSDAGVNVADNEGLLATVENLTFAGDIGSNRILCQYADDPDGDGSINLVNDLYGVEVELKEGTALVRGDGTTPLGYTDKISVTGRVTLEDGRKVVLKDASYTYVEEGSRRNWYIPLDRSYLSNYFGRAKYNGACAESTFQVLEKGEITAEGGTLKLVFPGEKTTLEDNDFLFEVKIPAGLSAEQIAKVNEELSDIEVGGGVHMIYLLHYRNGMQGALPFDFIGRSFSNGEEWMYPVELEGIFDNYEDALDLVGEYTDASLYENFEVQNAYSYVVDLSAATTDHSDKSYIYINQDYDTINQITVNAYTDTAIEDGFAIYQAIKADGAVDADREWVLVGAVDADSNSTENVDEIVEYIYFLQDKEEEAPADPADPDELFFDESSEEEEDFGNVYAQAYVDIADGLVSLTFFGEMITATNLETADFSEIAALYGMLYAYCMDDEEAESALFGEVLKADEALYYFDYTGFDSYESLGLYMFTFVATVPGDKATAYSDGIELAASNAGFVVGEFDGDLGLQNKETSEFFMALGSETLESGEVSFGFAVIVDAAGTFVTDPILSYDNAAEAIADYTAAYGAIEGMAGFTSKVGGDVLDLGVDGLEYKYSAPQWEQFADYGLYLGVLTIKPISMDAYVTLATALEESLYAAGFVDGVGAFNGWTAETGMCYWNADSHECVNVGIYYADEAKTALEFDVSICVDVNAAMSGPYTPASPAINFNSFRTLAR